MSSYFRWIKSGKKDDYLGAKPRSRSLDSKSLEKSGIRLIMQNVNIYLSKKKKSIIFINN